MKSKKDQPTSVVVHQQSARLFGNAVYGKKTTASKIIKYRAMIFERQMTNIFEIIF